MATVGTLRSSLDAVPIYLPMESDRNVPKREVSRDVRATFQQAPLVAKTAHRLHGLWAGLRRARSGNVALTPYRLRNPTIHSFMPFVSLLPVLRNSEEGSEL